MLKNIILICDGLYIEKMSSSPEWDTLRRDMEKHNYTVFLKATDCPENLCNECSLQDTLFISDSKDILEKLKEKGTELRGDARTQSLIDCLPAAEEDWQTEYLDSIISIRIVDSIDEAIDHINHYGSHHTDSILSTDAAAAERFMTLVDSADVFWNCSTRFSDGFLFGFGAEVGIATGKIHARGPMGLKELTSTKYIIYGNGQVR